MQRHISGESWSLEIRLAVIKTCFLLYQISLIYPTLFYICHFEFSWLQHWTSPKVNYGKEVPQL